MPFNPGAARRPMLSLFLTQSAIGSLLLLLLIPPRAGGRKFFQYTVGQSAGLMALGLALGSADKSGTPVRMFLFGGAIILLAASSGLFHLGRLGAGRALLVAGLAPALAGMIGDALAMIPATDLSMSARCLYPLDALTSGLVPGSALIAMILGHYYLNIPGLAIKHLQRLTLAFLGAVVLRMVVVSVSLARSRDLIAPLVTLLADTGRVLPAGPGLDPFVLVLVLIHLMFGGVASGIMAFMAWRTSLISSTQSTTGILYVALLMAIMGEMASRYLLTLTGLPL